MPNDRRLVSGIRSITDALAQRGLIISDTTVRRYYREGKLPGAYQLGERTSPVLMPVSEIDKFAKGER